MRSYGQICGIAKALEVIGDRWTLLIVRELLSRGACRYTDLRNGLPGIATNLLAQRLRELEDAGIVYSEAAPPPVATTVYQLTEHGAALEPVLKAIGDWGRPLLAAADETEIFQTHWLVLPLRTDLEDADPDQGPVRIQLVAEDEAIVVEAEEGRVTAYVGRVPQPDLIVEGSGRAVTRLMLGIISLAEARKRGVKTHGDSRILHRIRVRGTRAVTSTARHPSLP